MMAAALTIAGSDPSGGAGIQADLKTFHQFGVYGEAVITLVTVQNTQSVSRVEMMPADLVAQQIEAVITDIPPRAAKIGALGNTEIAEAVSEMARNFRFPLIVDPVMISKHGARLLSHEAEQLFKRNLLPHAFLVTPNIPEAEALADMAIRTEEEMRVAAVRILDYGCKAALIKGGHLAGEPADILCCAGEKPTSSSRRFSGRRVPTKHTHGTGCTYSAAITAALALGNALSESILLARRYVQRAIETAPRLGHGVGPVNHFAGQSMPAVI